MGKKLYGHQKMWPANKKKATEPGKDWEEFPVRIIDRAVNYKEARKMLKKSEFTSDVKSDDEDVGRHYKRKARHNTVIEFSSEESGEDENSKYPEAPKSLLGATKKSRSSLNLSDNRPKDDISLISLNSHVTRAEFATFEEKVFYKLEELKEIELENGRLIKQMLCSINKATLVDVENMPPGLPDLPLVVESTIAVLETWLDVDTNKQYLVNYLSNIGGKDMPDITRNIMAAIFTKDVAMKCNWLGRKGKIAFQELRLKDVVFGAVMKTTGGKGFTCMAAADITKNWLRAAR